MMQAIIDFLTTLNGAVGNLLVASIAVGALLYARREYRLKNRPFLSCELRGQAFEQGIAFTLLLRNSGNCPAQVTFDELRLVIGDEEFPTHVRSTNSVPVQGALEVPIGHIGHLGIQRYKERKYKRNRIEVHAKAKASSVYDESMGSYMIAEFEVDVLDAGVSARLSKFEVKGA